MENKEKLVEAIKAKAYQDGEKVKLMCKVAFEIAKEFEVELKQVGEICNEENIRLAGCQLGCFQ